LKQTAEACERAATRDHGHDLDALADLEIVSFELWGTYRMTVREAVISWAKEVELSEQLAAAEERMSDARRVISKALREAMQQAELVDAEEVVSSIEERMRRAREATGMEALE
jgi:ribosome-binding ATPase YchF (GTP1/OBG family)